MTRQFYFFILILFSLTSQLQAKPSLADIAGLIEAGQYPQALSQLDSLLAEDKHNPHYLFNRARALAGAGRQDEAIAQYLALIKAHPNLPEPYNNLAVIYIRQGKTEQAQALFNKAMATHPAYARVYKNLAAVNTARAQDAYARALQMPAASQAMGLEMADKLSLPKKPTPAVQAAPIVMTAAKPPAKPGMVYQANKHDADNKGMPAEKQPVAGVEANTVQTVLQNWAKAWSTKSVDRYLHFYSDDYSPAGMSHATWAAQRRARIQRPKWIRVTVRNFAVTAAGPARLRVRLEQEYAADNYRDVTRKEFVLQKFGGEWRIITERGLGYIVR